MSPHQTMHEDITALPAPIRRHSAFLNSYAPEDEGLYDDICYFGWDTSRQPMLSV